MSYSFREPEWPAVCECKYDEARDEMDREDCPFHSGAADNALDGEVQTSLRKDVVRTDYVRESVA